MGPILMVTHPEPPFVFSDQGDISIFTSIESARREIESIDVLDGVYEAFDSRGRSLTLELHEEELCLGVDESRLPDEVDLLGRLQRFIVRVGAARVGVEKVESLSLEEALTVLGHFLRER